MNEKNNKVIMYVLAFFVVVTMFLLIYLVYDKTHDNKDNLNNENNNISNNVGDNDSQNYVSYAIFEKIINDELNYLIGKKNLSELTDEEKSYMVMNLLSAKSEIVSFSSLDDAKNKSSLRNFEFQYVEIKYHNPYGLKTNDTNTVYKVDDGPYKIYKYVYDNGHGMLQMRPYMYDIKLENDGNKYIFKCKYVFARSTGDGPSDYKLYYNVSDINNNESFKTIKFNEDGNIYDDIKTYLDTNYDPIKDKLSTYTYVFSVENKLISLVDYYNE